MALQYLEFVKICIHDTAFYNHQPYLYNFCSYYFTKICFSFKFIVKYYGFDKSHCISNNFFAGFQNDRQHLEKKYRSKKKSDKSLKNTLKVLISLIFHHKEHQEKSISAVINYNLYFFYFSDLQ